MAARFALSRQLHPVKAMGYEGGGGRRPVDVEPSADLQSPRVAPSPRSALDQLTTAPGRLDLTQQGLTHTPDMPRLSSHSGGCIGGTTVPLGRVRPFLPARPRNSSPVRELWQHRL